MSIVSIVVLFWFKPSCFLGSYEVSQERNYIVNTNKNKVSGPSFISPVDLNPVVLVRRKRLRIQWRL